MTAAFVPLAALPLDPIVALNNIYAQELSFADAARMTQLIASSYFACGSSDATAFLIAFDQSANYDSENFFWFKARYAHFIYIDRVVVAAAARGRGLAQHMYARLFSQARADGYPAIVCEVNSDPPNPASDAFHARQGFLPVGDAILQSADKHVRYLSKTL